MNPKMRFTKEDGSNYEDWTESKLGDIFELKTGSNKKLSDSKTEDCCYPAYANATQGNLVKGYSDKYDFEYGLVLTGRGAQAGTLFYKDHPFSAVASAISMKLKLENISDSTYEMFNALLPDFKKYQSGSAQPQVTVKDISGIKVTYPTSIEEQQRIGEFFATLDKKIENLQQQHVEYNNLKKAYMQQIFSQKMRFNKEDGSNYEDWQTIKIGDYFNTKRGQVIAKSKISPVKDDMNKYPVYSSQTKNDGIMGYYKEYLFEDTITWTTDGAYAGTVFYRDGKFYPSNVCGVMIPKEGTDINLKMLSYILGINTLKHRVPSVIPKFMSTHMESMKVNVPTNIEEQQRIGELFATLDRKIELISEQIEEYKKLKLGYMQQMFI